MGDNINKWADRYNPETNPLDYVALARVVRSLEGAKRFKKPVGSPIIDQPKEIKKPERLAKIDPAKDSVKTKERSVRATHKFLSLKVEELKKKLEKLDVNALRNLLEQLESAKNLPKSANYQKIRKMLKKYLKDKTKSEDKAVDKVDK